MNMPGEISTNLVTHGSSPQQNRLSHWTHFVCYSAELWIRLPGNSQHFPTKLASDCRRGAQRARWIQNTRPYATNWRLFDGYNNPRPIMNAKACTTMWSLASDPNELDGLQCFFPELQPVGRQKDLPS
ncbi:hypothetical protein H4Q26_006562 [Puccinia striiformis f. sp. tritici PST-130]|nr:hypothetical protein H4Q26_006562 [Puccinia striiformis f. sp. tritici PST-130]